MILEDQCKQAQKEIEEKKEHLKQVRPSTAQMRGDNHKAKIYEN
jgi:hypothetical protein